MNQYNYPIESDSQEIGQHAVTAFHSLHPLSWRLTPTDGDSDVGLDMQIQLVDKKRYQGVFHAQIKGSREKGANGRSKSLNADQRFYSVELKISTLNYYVRVGSPVMLVFVDLSTDDDPRRCNAYYLWINDAIDSLLNGKASLSHLTTQTHTFQIPSDNLLNGNLDVLPYLTDRVQKRTVLEGLFKSVQGRKQDAVGTIADMNRRISALPVALDTVLNITEDPWLNAPKDSFAARLHEISGDLKLNNADLAKAALEKLELRIPEATAHELSEFYYLKSRLLTLSGLNDKSLDLYEKAAALSPERNKYHIASLEAQLRHKYCDTEFLTISLQEVQTRQADEYLPIKTKLLSLLGRHDEAAKLVDIIEPKSAIILRPLIYYLQKAYQDCSSLCQKQLLRTDLTERQKLALNIFQARSLFHIGAPILSGENDAQTIPFSGLPQMNPHVLRPSWESCKQAWDAAYSLGYPTDLELLIDVSCVLSTYFDEKTFFFDHLKHLAKIRPENILLQETLLQYATEQGDFATAQHQLANLPLTSETIVQQIFIFYQQANKHLAIKIAIEHIDLLLAERPSNMDGALLLAAVSAHQQVKTDQLNILLRAIRDLSNGSAIFAAYEFITGASENLLKKEAMVERLYSVYQNGEKDKRVLTLLFYNLNPTEVESSTRLLKVAEDIAKQRPFAQDDILHLCQAKATLNDWRGIIELLESNLERFEASPRLIAVKALAQDNLGDTPAALKSLEEAVKLESSDAYAYQFYAQLAARCGLTTKARELFELLLGRSRTQREKVQILRNMFVLEMRMNPDSPKLLELCERYGHINDVNSEEEEGFYLLAAFAATINGQVKITEEQKKEFTNRLQAYVERFPESRVLRAVKFDENKRAEEFLGELEKITGMTAEKREWYAQQERSLKGGLPVPFAVRPLILINVQDVLDLWEISKRVGKQDRQYHLTLSRELYAPIDPNRFLSKKLLIDEVSLFLLFDLELLERFIQMFPRIAIPRSVIGRLQDQALGVFTSAWYQKAKDIVGVLARFLNKIEQPSQGNDSSSNRMWQGLEEYKEILKSGQYVLYSDDAFARLYIGENNAEQVTITIVDILELVKQQNALPREDVARKYARLCRWNVAGVPVRYFDILLVLYKDFPRGLSISKSLEILNQNVDYRDFADAIWNHEKGYPILLRDIATFVAGMLEGEDGVVVENNIITAIWYWWYSKAQFTMQGETSKLNYLARSCWAVADRLSRLQTLAAPKQTAQRLWSIYKDLVGFVYGRDMNERIEAMMYEQLAHFVVSSTQGRSSDDIYGFLANGLELGTSESERFSKSYTDAILEQHVKNK